MTKRQKMSTCLLLGRLSDCVFTAFELPLIAEEENRYFLQVADIHQYLDESGPI